MAPGAAATRAAANAALTDTPFDIVRLLYR
jgi:hypothetical protein